MYDLVGTVKKALSFFILDRNVNVYVRRMAAVHAGSNKCFTFAYFLIEKQLGSSDVVRDTSSSKHIYLVI